MDTRKQDENRDAESGTSWQEQLDALEERGLRLQDQARKTLEQMRRTAEEMQETLKRTRRSG